MTIREQARHVAFRSHRSATGTVPLVVPLAQRPSELCARDLRKPGLVADPHCRSGASSRLQRSSPRGPSGAAGDRDVLRDARAVHALIGMRDRAPGRQGQALQPLGGREAASGDTGRTTASREGRGPLLPRTRLDRAVSQIRRWLWVGVRGAAVCRADAEAKAPTAPRRPAGQPGVAPGRHTSRNGARPARHAHRCGTRESIDKFIEKARRPAHDYRHQQLRLRVPLARQRPAPAARVGPVA